MSQNLPKPLEGSRDCPTKPPKASQNLAKPAKPSKASQSFPKPSNTSQSLTKPFKASWSKNRWKIIGKTRDYCARNAFLNAKTRHFHKRVSANPVKMQSNLTCMSPNTVKTRLSHKRLSENIVKLHANLRCFLRAVYGNVVFLRCLVTGR